MTELSVFHNRLRKLLNIDLYQLVDAGVMASDDTAEWERFQDNPWRWFIRAGDEQVQRVWAIMEPAPNAARTEPALARGES